MEYANSVAAELKKNSVDVTVDNRSEKIGFKIREARMDKLPYMLVVGQQEEENGLVSVSFFTSSIFFILNSLFPLP